MKETNFKFNEFSLKLEDLKSRVLGVLKEFDKEDSFVELTKQLEEQKKRGELKLAFVGQYNSGKSTIISALTGDETIHIDSNVATDRCTDYSWNDIKITDTPGILAGKIERHDALTEKAVVNSDLLVYVLTSSLFDDLLFENFIHLAYEEKLKEKMLVVVNKMLMEGGDFEELRTNYLDSLKTDFKKRNYEFESTINFIDALEYKEGLKEGEEEQVEESRFPEFIETLNRFVKERGFLHKTFHTPAGIMREKLKEVVVDDNDKNFGLVLKKYEQSLRQTQDEVKKEGKFICDKLQKSIMEEGDRMVSNLGGAGGVLKILKMN